MVIVNTSNGNGMQGIDLFGSNNNIIRGNIVKENVNGIEIAGNSDSNMIKGNTANDNSNDGIFLDATSNDNDVFFNRAFGNGDWVLTFDIEDLNVTPPLNIFKENKCGSSSPLGICN